jgi:hypothetical protein
VIALCVHDTEQPLPVTPSCVHGLLSSQFAALGQFPSHFSPRSTVPLPHFGWQSLSLFAFAPFGQQPSPLNGLPIAISVHKLLQLFTLPVNRSIVQALLSLQAVGQGSTVLWGSHNSPKSMTPSPQLAEQSASFAREHVDGQHPSPDLHSKIGCI